MYGQLKNVSSETLVTDLPGIVNKNNVVIADEFNELFDSSNNYLRKSLNAPTGRVKAHWGDFVNLKVQNLIFEGSNVDFSDIDNVDHSDLSKRFSWQLTKTPTLDASGILEYAHDTKMIITYADASNPISIGTTEYTYPITLRDELNAVEKIVDTLAKNISIKTADDEVFVDDAEDFATDETDTSILGFSYGSNFSETQDIQTRLRNIESRLTYIEQKLDNI